MAKEFKRNSKTSKDKGSASKTGKDSKKGKKPSFERYRDESRPSDFGSSAPRKRPAGFGEDKRKPFGDKPAFRKKRDDDNGDREKSFDTEKSSRSRETKSFDDKPSFRKRDDDRSERKPFNKEKPSRFSDDRKRSDDKPAFRAKRDESGDDKLSNNAAKTSRYTDKRKPFGDKPAFRKKTSDRDSDERPFRKSHDDDFYESKPSFVRESDKRDTDYENEYQAKKKGGTVARKEGGKDEAENYSRPYKKRTFEKKGLGKGPSKPEKRNYDGTVRLNKYIANAGICSRREADELIESGVVQVNGKIITEMGFKVKPTDVIKYGGQTLKKEKLVYLILNKPKDYITTVDDPQQRRTVLELIAGACRERIYPVGRLDRATTGLLMFTNDGELTKKLTHPRYGVRKVYHVELDKPLKRTDLEKIAEGIELEDGPIKVDEISYVGDGKDKASVGVEIHSGKNRIVRRIFENFGYNVRKLDRVVFGPLTKKDMPRGRWRFLTEAEVGMLKMISSE
jgi:23S rRNA pseudouridine2605 synthase